MRVMVAVVILASTIPANAGISSLDYLVDGAKHLSQWTTIDRCLIKSANTTTIHCYVYPQNGTTSVGDVVVNSDTLSREDLRRALNECYDYKTNERCWVNISGTPSKGIYGGKNSPQIENAQFEWLAK